MRVGVDGWRRRGRESLVKAARDAHPRVIHVVLHRWVHRVMMLRRACNHNYYYPHYYFYYSLSLSHYRFVYFYFCEFLFDDSRVCNATSIIDRLKESGESIINGETIDQVEIHDNYFQFDRLCKLNDDIEFERIKGNKYIKENGEFEKSRDSLMGEPKPEWKGLLSRSRWPLALIISPITPPSPRHPPAFFFLLFDDSFLFLVWMPSFFIVSGRFTCKSRSQQFVESIGFNLNMAGLHGFERGLERGASAVRMTYYSWYPSSPREGRAKKGIGPG